MRYKPGEVFVLWTRWFAWRALRGCASSLLALFALSGCDGYPCGKSKASLHTFCDEFGCPDSTLEQALDGYDCQQNDEEQVGGVYLIEGCGLVSLHFAGGFTGRTSYFDAESEKLVGVTDFNDVDYGPCHQSAYRAGRTPERDAQTCPARKLSSCLVKERPKADAREGCRAPSEAGCATCCELELFFQSFAQCQHYKAAAQADFYELGVLETGPCPESCAWCAACTLSEEGEGSPDCRSSP